MTASDAVSVAAERENPDSPLVDRSGDATESDHAPFSCAECRDRITPPPYAGRFATAEDLRFHRTVTGHGG